MPVTQVECSSVKFQLCTVFIENIYSLNDILHLSAIGSGVHDNCSADTSGNPCSKFHAAQTIRCRSIGNFRKHCTCLRRDPRSLHFNVSHWLCHLDHHTTDSLVSHKQIAAISDKRIWHMMLSAKSKNRRKCCFIRLDQHICRPTHTKRCMLFHWLFHKNPRASHYIFKFC